MNIPDHDPFLDLLYIKAWLFKKKRLFLFPGEARLPVCTIRGLPSSPRRQLCFFRRRRDDAHGAESWARNSGVRLGPMETRLLQGAALNVLHFVTLKNFYLNVPDKRSNNGCVAKPFFLDYRHLVEYIISSSYPLCAIYSPYTARSPHATVVPHSSLSLGTCLSPYQGC